MDRMKASRDVMEFIKRYRYVIIVFLVGLFLMLLPGPAEPVQEQGKLQQQIPEDLQTRLEILLGQMEGAGKVKVLLTQSAGERRIFQINENSDRSDTSGSIRRETVIITDSGRGEDGLVQQTLPPVYQGAVILCQGADSAAVRLAIIEAVSRATGLASHNISVLKMK